jgi:asparagine synthase (glutamine-hydrolysing)
MCAIVGILSKNDNSPQKIFKVLQLMEHRGPDGAGIWCENGITKAKHLMDINDKMSGRAALGHTRLSIVGGENGIQPFSDTQKSIGFVHNGEIYNYKHLRRNLDNKCQLISQTDSEVIMRLIEENLDNGLLNATQEAVKHLEGMYVFAVSDGNTIIVARDPVGIKQIYYAENESEKVFASEMKALWALGFKKTHRLEPGNILELRFEDVNRYASFQLPQVEVNIDQVSKAKIKYKKAIQQSVAKRVDGLDRVGLVLSGGVDSGLIAKILNDMGIDFICYSIGYKNSNDIKTSIDLSQNIGTKFRKKEINDNDVENALTKINRSIECRGLVQIEAAIFLHFAAEMAHEDGLKVMLTGQGADELFGGYPWYLDVVKEEGLEGLPKYMWNDIYHLYLDTLEREDKMTMAHSIELRVPFLDLDVIATAMSIDINLKVESGEDTKRKHIHRMVAEELGVPDYVAWRPKEVAQNGTGVHEALESLARRAGFNPETVERIQYEPIAQDYGSNYRYKKGYGEPHVWLYLDKIAYDAGLIPPDEIKQVEYYLGKINE